MKWVSPNGDLAKESVAWAATTTEAGSIGLKIVNADGATVRSIRVTVKSRHDGRVVGRRHERWRSRPGRHLRGPADAARRRRQRRPHDQAPVLVDTTLGDVDASKPLFYPQDADRLAATTTLRFKLTKPATVTWTVQDEAGATVLTLLDGEALPAGPVDARLRRQAPRRHVPAARHVPLGRGRGRRWPVPTFQYRTFKMRAFDPALRTRRRAAASGSRSRPRPPRRSRRRRASTSTSRASRPGAWR